MSHELERTPRTSRISVSSILILLFGTLLPALAQSPGALTIKNARNNWEINCSIRKDKFDFVLPAAMRSNNIDMWIVIDRGRGTEPMALDFGISTVNGQGIYVFTDRGGDRIERIQLGGETDLAEACGAYDLFAEPGDLHNIVSERDPQRIALNYLETPNNAEGLHMGDGLSYSDFLFLEQELGEPYRSRFVSAQRLIADFHGERVASELVEFAKAADITRTLLERALSNEVIEPGVTTHNQVAWWLEEQRQDLGLLRAWFPTVYVHLPDGGEIANTDRVIQRGDIIQIDWGVGRNNFATDMKRFAYVLRDGETKPSPGVQGAFAEAHKVREIIRRNVRPGRTGRDQIDALKILISDAGYVYTEDEQASHVEGIEVNVGMHAAGNIGHDLAAGLFEIYPARTSYMVRPNNIISLEFIVFTPAEEWAGAKIPVNVEENVVITHRGIEWLVPPQRSVLLIH
jgi:Xaa-Pro aminopeptidase